MYMNQWLEIEGIVTNVGGGLITACDTGDECTPNNMKFDFSNDQYEDFFEDHSLKCQSRADDVVVEIGNEVVIQGQLENFYNKRGYLDECTVVSQETPEAEEEVEPEEEEESSGPVPRT